MAGKFKGQVVVSWLQHNGDDRDMKLQKKFGFTDATGVEWTVPVGAVVNGASIPQVFWSTFGSPFIGDYRRASVIHDYYCQVKTRPSKQVHRNFYECCIAGGVGELRAKTMYAAVIAFGPDWPSPAIITESMTSRTGVAPENLATMSPIDYQDLIKWVEKDNPDIDKIQERALELRKLAPV